MSGLMQKFAIESEVNEWRLFVDCSKRSLKAALFAQQQYLRFIAVGHMVHLKESYENLELVLSKIGYTAHDWMMCGDTKVLGMFLGQQVGDTKYVPCFMCECVSGTAQQQVNTGSKTIGHQRHLLNLRVRKFCAQVLLIKKKNTVATPSY
jgi:hypothetical protein